jgi:Leucine-rich repeat (LRR) protein
VQSVQQAEIVLSGPDGTDENLERALSSNPGVERIDLRDSKITDLGLSHIAKYCHNLKTLQLSDTAVSDKGLNYLAPMRSILTLNLSRTRITDQGLAYLRQLPLVYLNVAITKTSGKGLKNLSEHGSKLKELNVRRSPLITDQDLETISQCFPNLTSLNISDTPVTSAGVEKLAKLEKLRFLWLAGDDAGDEAILKLTENPNLVWITVAGTKVSPSISSRIPARCRLEFRDLPGLQTARAVQGFLHGGPIRRRLAD